MSSFVVLLCFSVGVLCRMGRGSFTCRCLRCYLPPKCYGTDQVTKSFSSYISHLAVHIKASFHLLYVFITWAKKSQTSISAVKPQINMEIGAVHFVMRKQGFKRRLALPHVLPFLSLSLSTPPLRPPAPFCWGAFRPWHWPNEWARWFIARGGGTEGRDGEMEGGMEIVKGAGALCGRSETYIFSSSYLISFFVFNSTGKIRKEKKWSCLAGILLCLLKTFTIWPDLRWWKWGELC